MTVPEIDVAELAALPEGTVLIDVREPDEWAEAHVPFARHIPLGDLTERVDEVPTDDTVYVICKMGGRSLRAAEYLIGQGIDAVNVAGGTQAWISAGETVDAGEAAG